jgi:hypothetical protein
MQNKQIISTLESITERHFFNDYESFNNLIIKKIFCFISPVWFYLIITHYYINPELLVSNQIGFLDLLLIFISAIFLSMHISSGNTNLSIKENYHILLFLLNPKKEQIEAEIKAYCDIKTNNQQIENPSLLIHQEQLNNTTMSVSDWVNTYVSKKPSIVNYFISRYGNKSMHQIGLKPIFIWSQLLPLEKLYPQDLVILLTINPNLSIDSLKTAQLPPINQEQLNHIFSEYNSKQITLLLSNEFSIERYLMCLKIAVENNINFPLDKNLYSISKDISDIIKSDFPKQYWHQNIESNEYFPLTKAISTQKDLNFYAKYFQNCIKSYAPSLYKKEGMLFVSYSENKPYIIYYINNKLKLVEAKYQRNQELTNQDREKVKKILSNLKQ